MTVRLAVAEDKVLLVDVEDPRPEFPDSKAAIEGEKGRGLMYVRLLSAQVTWFLPRTPSPRRSRHGCCRTHRRDSRRRATPLPPEGRPDVRAHVFDKGVPFAPDGG